MKRGVFVFVMGIAGLLALFSAWVSLSEESGDAPASQAVVAKVNGKPITSETYQLCWRQLAMNRHDAVDITNNEEEASLKKQVLEQLITVELLRQKAEQLKIQVTPQEIQQRLAEIEQSHGGMDALNKDLATRGLTRETLLADLETTLLIQNVLQQEVFDKISVDPQEAEAFYLSTLQVFQKPERIRARQIVIRVAQDASETERRKAKRAIQKAAKRIQNGEPFDKVTMEVSGDPSAARGGDIGYFNRGQAPPEFERVAFSLDAGQVSDVVETMSGYYLIKVEEKYPPRALSFEEAKPEIMEYLKGKKQQEALSAYVGALRQEAKIEMAGGFME